MQPACGFAYLSISSLFHTMDHMVCLDALHPMQSVLNADMVYSSLAAALLLSKQGGQMHIGSHTTSP